MNKINKLAVLYGGISNEREVSLSSGKAIYQALINQQIPAQLVDAKDKQQILNLSNNGFDHAFIALHGNVGENGVIQALLEYQDIGYTGSGVQACAIAMDKPLTKSIWRNFGLPVKKDCLFDENSDYQQLSQFLNSKHLAIKPIFEGSSIGVNLVSNQIEYQAAINDAKQYQQKIMIEPWIFGRELTYAILGDKVLPPVEIVVDKNHHFYNYQAKYFAKNNYICPADIDVGLNQQIINIVKKAVDCLGVLDWARVDVIIDENNHPWLLEVNTAPGMTNHSLFPMAAQKIGLSFEQLVLEILRLSCLRK